MTNIHTVKFSSPGFKVPWQPHLSCSGPGIWSQNSTCFSEAQCLRNMASEMSQIFDFLTACEVWNHKSAQLFGKRKLFLVVFEQRSVHNSTGHIEWTILKKEIFAFFSNPPPFIPRYVCVCISFLTQQWGVKFLFLCFYTLKPLCNVHIPSALTQTLLNGSSDPDTDLP